MRAIKPLVVIALAGLSLGGGVAQAHTGPPRCRPGRPLLLAADAHAQVYRLGYFVFGCAYGYGRSTQLGSPYEESPGVGGLGGRDYLLSGTMVAYEEALEPSLSSVTALESVASWFVVVRNLATRKGVHKLATGSPSAAEPGAQPRAWVGSGPTTELSVKTDGSAAWIAADQSYDLRRGCCRYQVHAVDGHGGRLLAEGNGIDPHSLALAGDRVYWSEGLRSRSGELH